ncbi:hypothetical protein IQ249_10095 [Lusitaniella coriacea LEGE 07157]|uniref:Uncharacterized protein n=1 Tax=Lusitaniella coriacea LEGE 07157 TaxID=945747 RepID=A0A8J7DYT3_9CYAN|nr:hypothetical protein [Lusitaniella coriacea]MBE9116246.1 hypothetical protein [Lusitaniella coriacea LEGE 07157]
MRRKYRDSVDSDIIKTLILLNAVIAVVLFLPAIFYYEPGNPVRPERLDIDILAIISVFLGVSQFLYVTPLLLWTAIMKRWRFLRSVFVGAGMTILLNFIFWIITYLSKQMVIGAFFTIALVVFTIFL